ncbi:MAG: peptidoglycan-binding protein [Candidatus Sungiibacteriota bacterium]|uniref:Peptidoglycan-binding protein n=1 Tax=Candidatus Sungiibacteriota bacterium TaxID=2750080 RepID=A0A7T5RJY9_9BACT|nr:MAG: peptidoglycan-binding protein [Candidatus Sungbacteria bacterium]
MLKKVILITILVFMPFLSFAASFDRDLYFGLKSDSGVTQLQEFLRDEGVYSGPVTGNFFLLTRAAVKKFQEREKIVPAVGYFGPKTRARANTVLAQKTAPVTKEAIIEQIQKLQAELKALQEKLAKEQVSTTTVPADTTPPSFVKKPQVFKKGFIDNSPLGVHYPYRVVFDWAVDETGVVDESVTCTPTIKVAKPAGRLTEYFPEPHTDYSCTVSVKDQAGNPVRADVSFTTPNWINLLTVFTNSFPEVEVDPYKLGDFTIYNGTTSDVLLANFETLIIDEMDSTPNRARKIYLILRDGTSSADKLISKTEFTFITEHPKIGSPHKSVLSLGFDVTVKQGEERKFSLWVEQFKYVKSGKLQIKTTKINTVTNISTVGGWDFLLTKEPPL